MDLNVNKLEAKKLKREKKRIENLENKREKELNHEDKAMKNVPRRGH